jgi:hypothetical protein
VSFYFSDDWIFIPYYGGHHLIGLKKGGDGQIRKWNSKKMPFLQWRNGLYNKNSTPRPVSLRRNYPDQVAKGCPFPDSQMMSTPLTRQINHKSKF